MDLSFTVLKTTIGNKKSRSYPSLFKNIRMKTKFHLRTIQITGPQILYSTPYRRLITLIQR